MDRRTFLSLTGGAAAAMTAPSIAQARGSGNTRTLVLLELAGCNDGINTVILFGDPAYARSRPRIAVARDQVRQLDPHVGLHPELEPLMAAWNARDLAVVRGVGYARPNRSHFRSIDIWETASDSDRVLADGWIARAFRGQQRDPRSVADAVSLGGKSSRIMDGQGIRAVSMANPERFLRQARGLKAPRKQAANPALAHILAVQAQVDRAAYRLGALAERARQVGGAFQGPFGRQLRVAARLIIGGTRIPVIKVTLGGFDTHINQAGRHRFLMRQLGGNLAAFRKALIDGGVWRNVL